VTKPTHEPRGRPRYTPQARPINAVPPAQYDAMRAPIYKATPAQATRTGALDFKRIESRGFRC